MSLFIKSALMAATRNPGEFSNSVVLYKRIADASLADRSSLISLCKSFLVDANIGYKADTNTLEPDGSIDIGRLYSEFEYADGRSSVLIDTSVLQPAEDGSNAYIDTSVKVGQLLFEDTILSPEDVNEALYSFRAVVYDSIYLNRYYYDLANKKSFAQVQMGDRTPNADCLYFNYSAAKLICFYITPSANANAVPYALNVVFLGSDQLEYQEDLSANFYQSGGQYYADSSLNPLYLRVLETFFPFVVIKKDGAINGPVYSSLNSNEEPISFDQENYVSIEDFVFTEPAAQNISCSLGQAIINYAGETIQVEDAQICGAITVTRFMSIIPLDVSALNLYKNFTSLTTYLVDIYAFNYRYIEYKKLVSNVDTYVAFKDNGSLATSTVKYASEQLDFSNYSSLREDGFGSVDAINFSLLVYESSRTEASALLYDFFIPINALVPVIQNAAILGNNIIVTTDYATNLIYYFGEEASSVQTVAVTDTSNGQGQETQISIVGKTGRLNVKAYNYFYTLDFSDEKTKASYISAPTEVDLLSETTIPSLSLKIRTGSPLTDQTIYAADGSSSTTLSFTDFSDLSILSYYVLASYSSTINFDFLFTFTLATGSESLDLVIGDRMRRLQSGTAVTISREEIFAAADRDGLLSVDLVLDSSLKFSIPITFKSTSANAPQITSVTTPVIAFNGSGGASLSFSISHRYSRTITYAVKSSLNADPLLEVTLARRPYGVLQPYFSAGTTEIENITTALFTIDTNADDLVVEANAYNLDVNGELSAPVSLSSSNVALIKRLNQTTPASFKFYQDSGKTTPATQIERAKDYYAFLQLYDLAGAEINFANYGNYIATDSIEVIAVESAGDNIDIENVSVTDEGDYLYKINIGSSSPFNDTSFSIKADFNTLID